MARSLLAAVLLCLSGLAVAAGGEGAVQKVGVDISNQGALQRGAKYFVNYCLGCHSAQYVRYNRLARDLGLTEEQLEESIMFTGERPFDTMQNAMPKEDSATWFGRTPPDLSLMARARGADYVYSFLKSFYLDDTSPTGTNNLVLPGASMPHVLWEEQGIQEAVFREVAGKSGETHEVFDRFELVRPGRLTQEEFDRLAKDLTTFLVYISEPVQLERQRLGVKVILYLVVFFLFALLLKKELWKDVK